MKVLVIGGTGTVGGWVTRDLLGAGHEVRVLTRSPERARGLPGGASAAIGDLEKPESLPAAFEGIEALFMITPLHPEESRLGVTAVDQAKQSGVRKIVYSSVIMPPNSEIIPHFRSKIPVEQEIRHSGLDYVVLRPTNFYQNDYWSRESMLSHGVYGQPVGDVGINRVDARDIAGAAVAAITTDDFNGATQDVGGPEEFTGEQIAQVWSKYLGKEIRYAGDDLDAWAENVRDVLPEFLIHDFAIMYEFFQEQGCGVPPSAFGPLREMLGHEPRTFDAFAEETAREWLGAGVPR